MVWAVEMNGIGISFDLVNCQNMLLFLLNPLTLYNSPFLLGKCLLFYFNKTIANIIQSLNILFFYYNHYYLNDH